MSYVSISNSSSGATPQVSSNRDGGDGKPKLNTIIHGDCVHVMRQLLVGCIDFILTDPPYLVDYHDRTGRSIQNDANEDWIKPAFSEAYRVLRQNSFMVTFYGWTEVDRFMDAWRSAGFRAVGHLVFLKRYSSKSRFLRYQHEQAYLLAKGRPALPENPIADVIDMPYSGNATHPTQKPVTALLPLIEAFSRDGSVILDPFCGSGSTLVAARQMNRSYLGIEMDAQHYATANKRLAGIPSGHGCRTSDAECA
jgi:DNA modification methylase